ncbi:hypothetical protein CVT25_010527 [Psilocybe cyanescens]|uniref:Uncharacterized protein n=1 Tax=Psilocybe cyanescens TaxID=93625 RepID=A0A409XTR2_PSICY|nr:hypothetical protein CVT25_010527 [Psilocybe cyanescens]
MPHLLRCIASSFTQNSKTNQLETPIFDTPLTEQTVEELETLQREILTEYNKTINQKETANQNYCLAAAKLAHHQARSLCLKLNQVKQELYQRLPLIAKTSSPMTRRLRKSAHTLKTQTLFLQLTNWQKSPEPTSKKNEKSILPGSGLVLDKLWQRFCLPPPLPRDLPSLRLYLNDLQEQQLVNEARPTLCQLQQIAQRARHQSSATTVENPDTFDPNAPSSSVSIATNMHLDILSEIVATTQRTTNTLTPIMEELTKIFSTTPESQTPQVNHMGTNELKEAIDFTPSEA